MAKHLNITYLEHFHNGREAKLGNTYPFYPVPPKPKKLGHCEIKPQTFEQVAG